MVINIGGARNIALDRDNGFATRQKITGSGPAHNQAAEEELRHQSRDT